MSRNGVRRLFRIAILLPVCGGILACDEPVPAERLTVSLRNSESFVYPTVGGDEEGATITVQAQHAAVSEIRRNAETNWVATYVYQPMSGYIGSDYVQLEVFTGSDGASPPNTRTIRIEFQIRE